MPSAELDPTSGVPLYRQIKDLLRTEIIQGRLAAETPVTEDRLLARFDVSRAPIRQALKELATEGYVYRKQGRGTFPVPGASLHRPADIKPGNLHKYLRERGLDATSEVSDLGRQVPPMEIRQHLALEDHVALLHFLRLITVEGEPLIESDVYVNAPHEFSPTTAELEANGSAFDLLEDELGIALERTDHEAWATAASKRQAAALGVHENSPLLVIDTTFFTRGAVPAGWRRAIHRSDEFKYQFVTHR
ncbi:GntR family transcriptional regulator [Rothia uropygialis]|uniref:GntR family transcriptional regulator n=1 Tax=Kocuria sp. 36 TaxID=1415402 RepID=UPI00101BE153|nr:GntR family transcriptional regulator [Kocuria sp. 36]